MTAPVSADNVLELIAPSPRVSGSIMRCPLGTSLPTHSYDPLTGPFTDNGFVDEHGVKQKEDRSATDVFVWGGDLVGTLQEKYSRTVSFKLLQMVNATVLGTGYGTFNVSQTAATAQHGKELAVKMNPRLLDTVSWVIDGFYQDALARIVLPIARIVTIGEVEMTHRSYMGIDVTGLKCYPDSNGNHGYMYFNDGQKSGSGS